MGRRLCWVLFAGASCCSVSPKRRGRGNRFSAKCKGWDELRVDARWSRNGSTSGQVKAPRGYSRGGSGTSAFRVATSSDNPSWLVRTASNPVSRDTRPPKSTDEALKPTILTWGSWLRRSDTVTRLSCNGMPRFSSTRSQRASVALWIADTPSPTVSHTL